MSPAESKVLLLGFAHIVDLFVNCWPVNVHLKGVELMCACAVLRSRVENWKETPSRCAGGVLGKGYDICMILSHIFAQSSSRDPEKVRHACAYRPKGRKKAVKPKWVSCNSQKYYPSYNISPQSNTYAPKILCESPVLPKPCSIRLTFPAASLVCESG